MFLMPALFLIIGVCFADGSIGGGIDMMVDAGEGGGACGGGGDGMGGD